MYAVGRLGPQLTIIAPIEKPTTPGKISSVIAFGEQPPISTSIDFELNEGRESKSSSSLNLIVVVLLVLISK